MIDTKKTKYLFFNFFLQLQLDPVSHSHQLNMFN